MSARPPPAVRLGSVGMPALPPAVQRFVRDAPATAVFTAVCLAVFVITAVQARSLTHVWDSPLGSQMILYGPLVEGAGYLRPLTAGFLHLDISHLFVNMLMLVLVGAEIERYLGSGPFAVAYLASVIGSSAIVLTFDFAAPTAGASGALFALIAVLVAIAYRRGADLRAPIALLLVNVAYTFLAQNVSVWGHAGGLVWGALMAWPLTSPKPRVRWGTAWAALAIAVVAAWIPTIPLSTPFYGIHA